MYLGESHSKTLLSGKSRFSKTEFEGVKAQILTEQVSRSGSRWACSSISALGVLCPPKAPSWPLDSAHVKAIHIVPEVDFVVHVTPSSIAVM